MDCHEDSEGHTYDFAFGLGWDGVIDDARTARYKR
jgi:beta-glucosidase